MLQSRQRRCHALRGLWGSFLGSWNFVLVLVFSFGCFISLSKYLDFIMRGRGLLRAEAVELSTKFMTWVRPLGQNVPRRKTKPCATVDWARDFKVSVF